MGRTVTRRVTVVDVAEPAPPITSTSLVSKAIAFLTLTNEAKAATERATGLKKEMMDALHTSGEEDDKGHKYLYFKNPIAIGGKKFSGLKRERRVSRLFDEDAAETLLEGKGLLERVQKEVVTTVLDQDEVYVLNQEGLLTDEEVDSLFAESESFAFKPVAD